MYLLAPRSVADSTRSMFLSCVRKRDQRKKNVPEHLGSRQMGIVEAFQPNHVNPMKSFHHE